MRSVSNTGSDYFAEPAAPLNDDEDDDNDADDNLMAMVRSLKAELSGLKAALVSKTAGQGQSTVAAAPTQPGEPRIIPPVAKPVKGEKTFKSDSGKESKKGKVADTARFHEVLVSVGMFPHDFLYIMFLFFFRELTKRGSLAKDCNSKRCLKPTWWWKVMLTRILCRHTCSCRNNPCKT